MPFQAAVFVPVLASLQFYYAIHSCFLGPHCNTSFFNDRNYRLLLQETLCLSAGFLSVCLETHTSGSKNVGFMISRDAPVQWPTCSSVKEHKQTSIESFWKCLDCIKISYSSSSCSINTHIHTHTHTHTHIRVGCMMFFSSEVYERNMLIILQLRFQLATVNWPWIHTSALIGE